MSRLALSVEGNENGLGGKADENHSGGWLWRIVRCKGEATRIRLHLPHELCARARSPSRVMFDDCRSRPARQLSLQEPPV